MGLLVVTAPGVLRGGSWTLRREVVGWDGTTERRGRASGIRSKKLIWVLLFDPLLGSTWSWDGGSKRTRIVDVCVTRGVFLRRGDGLTGLVGRSVSGVGRRLGAGDRRGRLGFDSNTTSSIGALKRVRVSNNKSKSGIKMTNNNGRAFRSLGVVSATATEFL